jgi:hypothetical protein
LRGHSLRSIGGRITECGRAGAWMGSSGERERGNGSCAWSRTVARRTGVSSGRWSSTRSIPSSIRPGGLTAPPLWSVLLLSLLLAAATTSTGKPARFGPGGFTSMPRDHGSDHTAECWVLTDPTGTWTGSCAGHLQVTGCASLSSD